MPSLPLPRVTWLLVLAIGLVLLPGQAAAFGAGNIPSIAQVEGHNWRHGDIEDMLAGVAFLHGKKWTSMLIKRTYFGNWLRDYSQAVDVGSLKGVNAATVRILVWVLSFMAFGYATEEFEVTEERLGCYRPEEHIDNPLGYADGLDARTFDPRLRGPVEPVETEIDMKTGMKNYIANETGQWATSAGYIRFSFARSIHFGRLYTCGERGKGKDENLCEALRCLGQALHCLEDFGAHSNYCELALRELGHHSVFPHCGTQTEINVQGKRIYPIVTGTFGAVDFLHSVIGEANDHFTQSEVDEVDVALKNAEGARSGPVATGDRGLFDGSGPTDFISLLSKLPDMGTGFASEARELKEASEAQERENQQSQQRARADNVNVVPGMSPDFDPVKTAKRIYPILVFRDKIVKAISRGIAKVPGLEKLLEHISETLTAFVLGLLAPFIRPIINSVTKVLKDGSSGVISASSKSQLEPWENNRCSDPTHSMLSKDHFTNVLNSCAGRVAATILQYAVPRVVFAWENPNVPVDEVVNDVIRAFHHPALRNDSIEIQRDMFKTVRAWADQHPRRHEIDRLLSSESVKAGKNHILNGAKSSSGGGGGGGGGGGHSHSAFDTLSQLGHGKVAGSLWSQVRTRDLDSMSGNDGKQSANYVSSSPAPDTSKMPTPPSYTSMSGGGEAASYMNESNTFQAGYNAPPPPGQYYQSYGQQPPGGPQGYSGGQWQQPPQGYGGNPGYGGAPPQGGYPYGQDQPPSWNQYPGQGRY
ncbi:Heterokaryon incompatibility protein Het-C [Metarhizium rileyi]|uniref:Heterokaryon incompatibility protein Het-C n=1 Tax=Metarhizium rileyi (strain RCEF 4871) TaxID=1649241 RepID=A0A166XCP6_METRR|nr:Heterokaryon incompatibility protein Het-C [Metarhizium rileyi RCEF 4871]